MRQGAIDRFIPRQRAGHLLRSYKQLLILPGGSVPGWICIFPSGGRLSKVAPLRITKTYRPLIANVQTKGKNASVASPRPF